MRLISVVTAQETLLRQNTTKERQCNAGSIDVAYTYKYCNICTLAATSIL